MKGEAARARPSGQLSGSRTCREDGAARDAELETKQNNFLCRPAQLTQQQPSADLYQPALAQINPYYHSPNGEEG